MTYRYSALGTIVTFLVTLVVWFVSVFSCLNAAGGLLFIGITAFFGVFAVGMTRVALTRAAIRLDDAGVGAEILGIRTRFISWNSAKKIVKIRAPVAYGTYINSFQVYSDDHGIVCRFLVNVCGNIAFDERIGGARELLDHINIQAREHDIPLFAWDLETNAQRRSFTKPTDPKGGRIELPVGGF